MELKVLSVFVMERWSKSIMALFPFNFCCGPCILHGFGIEHVWILQKKTLLSRSKCACQKQNVSMLQHGKFKASWRGLWEAAVGCLC